MLHDFPSDAPYHEAENLRRLEESPPETEAAAFEDLVRLLPDLGDEIIPVWTSDRLPFHPVVLAAFRDKQNHPLVAVVCETGLLAVVSAEAGENWTYLQIPHVWPRAGYIRGLWASNALRPFGPWTELLILIAPLEEEEPEAQRRTGGGKPCLYRALVRQKDGEIFLEPAREDISQVTQSAGDWEMFGLPPGYEWLSKARVLCGGGADPFDPQAHQPSSRFRESVTSAGGSLVAWGRNRVARIEAGIQILDDDGQVIHDLEHPALGVTCLPQPEDNSGLVVVTDRRQLLTLVPGKERWNIAWEQTLRRRVTAVDHLAMGKETEHSWPDLFVSTSRREVVRFRYIGRHKLAKLWNIACQRLAEIADLEGGADWSGWCRKRFEEINEESSEGRAQRRALLYLAVDRVLADSEALADQSLLELCADFVAREPEASVLLPSVRRLLEALDQWRQEKKPSAGAIPELAEKCYEKLPYSLQEAFDSRLRGFTESERKDLKQASPAFGELCENIDNVRAFYDADSPLRQVGNEVLRGVHKFVTAGFCMSRPWRLLVPIPPEHAHPEKHYAFLGLGRSLELHWLVEEARQVAVRSSKEALVVFETPFTPVFAETVQRKGAAYLVIGARQGKVVSVRWTSLIDEMQEPEPLEESFDGEITAACKLGPEKLLVAHNQPDSSEILQIELDSTGRPKLQRRLQTHLRQIQALFVLEEGGKSYVVAGDLGDVVLLSFPEREDEAGRLTEIARRHLGSVVLTFTCLSRKVDKPDRIISGTRNGHVFAINAQPEEPPWLRVEWIQHVPHGVSEVIPGFAKSNEVGLLSAQGAVRVFDSGGTQQLYLASPVSQDPAEAAVYLPCSSSEEAGYLIIAGASGVLTTYLREPPTEKDSHFEKAKRSLDSVEMSCTDQIATLHETEEIGCVFQRLEQGEPIADVYASSRTRAARRFAIRLAMGKTQNFPNSWAELWECLRLEDLALFLRQVSALSEKSQESIFAGSNWKQTVRDRLSTEATRIRGKHGKTEEVEKETEHLVWALDELCRLDPRKEGLPLPQDSLQSLPLEVDPTDWAAYLVALQIVQEVGEGIGEEADLLEPLLNALARLPLAVTFAASTLVSGSKHSEAIESVLRNLVQLGNALKREARKSEIRAGLQDLSKALKIWRKHAGSPGLFADLIRLLDRNHAKDYREMLELLTRARHESGTGVLDALVAQPLAQWLPRAAPEDASLAAEKSWLQEARRRAEGFERRHEDLLLELEQRVQPDVGWAKLLDHLNRMGLRLWRHQVGSELEEIHQKVDLRVQLAESRRPSPQEVELTLTLEPDSLQHVEDFRARLLFQGEEGLLDEDGSAVEIDRNFGALEPSRGGLTETVRLSATTVQPKQERVDYVVKLQWKTGENTFHRQLDLPKRAPKERGIRAPLPDTLSAWSRQIGETIRASTNRTLFVALDEDLGRMGLVEKLAKPGEIVVDLDEALRELGPGRAFPRLLDTSNVLAAFRGETAPQEGDTSKSFPWDGPLHWMSRSDDLWHRLMTLRNLESTFQDLMQFLLGSQANRPSLVFFVSNRIARALRLRIPRVPIFEAWRLAISEKVEEGTVILEEIKGWLTSDVKALTTTMTEPLLRAFRGDLRLLALARSQWKEKYFEPPALDHEIDKLLLSKSAREVYLADLEGLSHSAVHLLLLAAVSKTVLPFDQVAEGMVSAEEIRAWKKVGGQHQASGALLTKAGQVVDATVYHGIRSDKGRHERRLKVEGFSLAATPEYPSELRGFVQLLDEESIQQATKELTGLGVAASRDGVVRTLDPYRRVIRRIQAQRNPFELFQFLTGGESPFSETPLGAFQEVTVEVLQEMQPGLSERWASSLRALSAAWKNLLESRKVSTTQLRQAIQELTGFHATLLAGEDEEGQAPWKHLVEDRNYLFGIADGVKRKKSDYYVLVLAPKASTQFLGDLLDEIDRQGRRKTEEQQDQEASRLLVLRSPSSRIKSDHRGIELSQEDLRDAFLSPNPQKDLWARVRAQSGLVALAPFQREGALPPGSPLFFGREKEVDWILRQATEKSILIVGSRQIGKTSLLNKVRSELEQRRDLELIFIELQGRGNREELISLLHERCGAPEELRHAPAGELVDHLIAKATKQGRKPIFMLNEIDFLIENDMDFLRRLRGAGDEGRARFLMTGYFQAAASTLDPKSPLYHWTAAPDGSAYIVLDELTDDAARSIVKLLEERPLELEWENEDEKEDGVQEILQRSYRIPHLVQAICLGLVEHAEETGRIRLRCSDVKDVAADPRYSAWEFVNKVDLGSLMPEVKQREKGRLLAELFLLVAMKTRYFQGNPPPIQQRVRERDPKSLRFSSTDLREWLPSILRGLFRDKELDQATVLIDQIDIEALLRRMSLTLLLSWHPETGTHYFQSHLYPLEVYQQLGPGETVDDRILDTALKLYPFLA